MSVTCGATSCQKAAAQLEPGRTSNSLHMGAASDAVGSTNSFGLSVTLSTSLRCLFISPHRGIAEPQSAPITFRVLK
ncbi:hypothetical protein L3X38_006979 [Prunus dulcis]|uniref:Uncharacterized protein n=1 Tax=Prunus dulcis TaxID=3755 RepID=A0AAD4ZTV1_PRUDU|nr:hypothetical protein L3X38_006979 [Prunus dulcis]